MNEEIEALPIGKYKHVLVDLGSTEIRIHIARNGSIIISSKEYTKDEGKYHTHEHGHHVYEHRHGHNYVDIVGM